MNIETNKKNTPSGKSVLLFSGGLDSIITNYLMRPDILLVFPHKQKYELQERKAIEKLKKLSFIGDNVVYDYRFNFSELERDDAIIPLRNLYFLAAAIDYGETIYFGSIQGDRSLDKSEYFFYQMETMLNHLYQDQHWCEGRIIQIKVPFKKKTKTELVSEYLKAGGSVELLFASYSCYEGKDLPCGICKPCFRKWVALTNNEINTENYFNSDPSEVRWLDDLIPSIIRSNYRGEKEDSEIMRALRLHKK